MPPLRIIDCVGAHYLERTPQCRRPHQRPASPNPKTNCPLMRAERQEHAPPLAGAHVVTGFEVHDTGDVDDKAASGNAFRESFSKIYLVLLKNIRIWNECFASQLNLGRISLENLKVSLVLSWKVL
jgi:hypothetical protein